MIRVHEILIRNNFQIEYIELITKFIYKLKKAFPF